MSTEDLPELPEGTTAVPASVMPNGPIGTAAAAAELIADAPDPKPESGFTPGCGSGNSEEQTFPGASAPDLRGEWAKDLRDMLGLVQLVLKPRAPKWSPTDEEIPLLADGFAPLCAKYLGEIESPEMLAGLALAGYLMPRMIPQLPARSHAEEEAAQAGESEAYSEAQVITESFN